MPWAGPFSSPTPIRAACSRATGSCPPISATKRSEAVSRPTCPATRRSSTSSTPSWWPSPSLTAARAPVATAARCASTSGGGGLANDPRQALSGVRDGERPRPRAHGFEACSIRQEARERVYEPLSRDFALRKDDSAPRGLDEPRIGRLLVTARPWQRDEDGRHAEAATFGDRARPAAPHEQRRRRVDVAEFSAHVWPHGVARPDRGRQGAGQILEPRVIARFGIVAALVEDLTDREKPRQRLAHHAVDPVRALGSARDIDERHRRVEAELLQSGFAAAPQDFASHGIARQDDPIRREAAAPRLER